MNDVGVVLDTLERVRLRIIDNITSTGVKASGATQASLTVEAKSNGGVLTGRSYFQGLETGRPAGPVPGNFSSIIKQWIIDKGLTPTPRPYKTNRPHKYTEAERSLNIMAAAVAHSIFERGFKPWRDGGRVEPPTNDIYTNVIDEEVQALQAKIMAEVKQQITNAINNG